MTNKGKVAPVPKQIMEHDPHVRKEVILRLNTFIGAGQLTTMPTHKIQIGHAGKDKKILEEGDGPGSDSECNNPSIESV
jgi:hypothetical protein